MRLHSSTVSWIGFYNINTKTTVWGAPGAVTTDHPRINQGEFINLGAEQEIKEIGHGYFVTVYSLDRGYNIPIAIKDFIWNSRFRYENLVTTGHSFFVFIDDPKNLNFPLVNVIQN